MIEVDHVVSQLQVAKIRQEYAAVRSFGSARRGANLRLVEDVVAGKHPQARAGQIEPGMEEAHPQEDRTLDVLIALFAETEMRGYVVLFENVVNPFGPAQVRKQEQNFLP